MTKKKRWSERPSERRLLPDGKTTQSAARYVREWRKLGRQVEKALGGEWGLFAFDPRLSFRAYARPNLKWHFHQQRTLQLDTDIAFRIVELAKKAGVL